MTPAIIELVDSEIRALAPDGDLLRAPGYALLDDDGIITGEDARRGAWLHPQKSFSQFWHQLTLAPLPAASRHARHYADLAYAQLRRFHEDLGEPEAVLFAVPGSFSREQLAILLGLAEALPVRTAGLVDAAVAAGSGLGHSGELLHLDLQLHQAVVTRLRTGDRVERLAVDLVPDAGLRGFQDHWAQFIANQFIREYRFDPLHAADGEQQLYDKLPDWLRQLGHRPEITIEMTTPRGTFHLGLQREALLDHCRPRLDKLLAAIARIPDADAVVCSDRVTALPGIAELTGARPLPEDSVIQGCLAALDSICTEGPSVDFVTRLPARGTGPAAAPKAEDNTDTITAAETDTDATAMTPTHLLYRHCAYAIGEHLAIHSDNKGLRFSRQRQAPVMLTTDDGHIVLESHDGHTVTDGDANRLTAGDTIRLGGETLTLIRTAAIADTAPGA